MPRLNAIAGVKAAGATSVIPFGGGWSTASFNIEGLSVPPGQNGPWGDIRIVSPRFFDALRIPLKKGRYFDDSDRQTGPQVAIIDEQFVKKYFPHVDPIGKRITFGARRGATDSTWITIVGVVGHAAHEGLDAEPRIQYYFPTSQSGIGNMTVAMRTTGNPTALLSAAREAVHSIDRNLPLSAVNTMDKLVESSVGQRKLSMMLLGLFSLIAVVLASIGIYGVMSYSVTQRSRELGIRMALGAARSRVLALGRRPGDDARRHRSGDRSRGGVRAHAVPLEPTLLGRGDGSGDVRARLGVVGCASRSWRRWCRPCARRASTRSWRFARSSHVA